MSCYIFSFLFLKSTHIITKWFHICSEGNFSPFFSLFHNIHEHLLLIFSRKALFSMFSQSSPSPKYLLIILLLLLQSNVLTAMSPVAISNHHSTAFHVTLSTFLRLSTLSSYLQLKIKFLIWK